MANTDTTKTDVKRASAFGNNLDLSGFKPQKPEATSEETKKKLKEASEEEGFVSRQVEATTTKKKPATKKMAVANTNKETVEMAQLGVRISTSHKEMFEQVIENHYTGKRVAGKAMERAIELLHADAVKATK